MFGASLLSLNSKPDPRRLTYVGIRFWDSNSNGVNLSGLAQVGDIAITFSVVNNGLGNPQSPQIPYQWNSLIYNEFAYNQQNYQLINNIGWKKLTSGDISSPITQFYQNFIVVYRPLNTINTVTLGTYGSILFTNTTPTPLRTAYLGLGSNSTFSTVGLFYNFGGNTMTTTSTVTPTADVAYGVFGAKVKLWNNLLGTDPNPFTSNSTIGITGAASTYANTLGAWQFIFS